MSIFGAWVNQILLFFIVGVLVYVPTTTVLANKAALHCNVEPTTTSLRIGEENETTGHLLYRKSLLYSWESICQTNFFHLQAKIICRTICNDSSITDLYAMKIYRPPYTNPSAPGAISQMNCPENATVLGDCHFSNASNICQGNDVVTLQCGYPVSTPLPTRTLPKLDCGRSHATLTFEANDAYDEIKSVNDITLENKPNTGCNTQKYLNSSNFSMNVDYTNCNLTVQHNETHISYLFSIKRKIPLSNGISYKPSYRIPLACHVKKVTNAETSGDTNNPDVTQPPIGSPIDVDMTLTLFKDAAYTEELKVSDSIAIGAEIYVKADAPFVTHTNVNLQNCWSTSEPDKNANPKQELISNRCPMMEGLQINYYSGTQTRFHFKAFSTNTTVASTTMYIHCDAVRCVPSASCVKVCGATSRRHRRSVAASKYKNTGSIIIGGKGVYGLVGGNNGPYKVMKQSNLAISLMMGKLWMGTVMVASLGAFLLF